jgi:squalene cyclase
MLILSCLRESKHEILTGSVVECTSEVIQALTSFRKHYRGHRREEINKCIHKADKFIQSIQRSDGSWLVLKLHFVKKEFTNT